MSLEGDSPQELDLPEISLIKEKGTNGGLIWIPTRVQDRKHPYLDAAQSFPFQPKTETPIDDRRTVRTYSVVAIPDGIYAANTVSRDSGALYKVIFKVEETMTYA